MVSSVEYPINGGNDTVKMSAQSINHPPLISLHCLAYGSM